MLKSKASIERWAREIVECEKILSNPDSSDLEVEQAESKVEAVMELYGSDFETLTKLILKIEELMS